MQTISDKAVMDRLAQGLPVYGYGLEEDPDNNVEGPFAWQPLEEAAAHAASEECTLVWLRAKKVSAVDLVCAEDIEEIIQSQYEFSDLHVDETMLAEFLEKHVYLDGCSSETYVWERL